MLFDTVESLILQLDQQIDLVISLKYFLNHLCPFGKHALTYKILALITNRLQTRTALLITSIY